MLILELLADGKRLPSAELEKASENAYNYVKEKYDYYKKALEYMDIIQKVYDREKKK